MGQADYLTVSQSSPYLLRTVLCDGKLKDFVYNREFRCTKNDEYFINGEIKFGREPYVTSQKGLFREDKSYDTRFGPCVEHNGRKFENCNQNVSLAMRRLTRARVDLNEHRTLKLLQDAWFIRNNDFITMLRTHYESGLEEYTDAVTECAEHYADPHPKKNLRVQGWEELHDTGYIGGRLWIRKVLYKMKMSEWAKLYKEPRMIGDLGILASLQGFRVTEYIKRVMHDRPIFYQGGIIMFCKTPSYQKLKYIFEQLIYPSLRYFFVYFSDDSCYSVHGDAGVFRCNVDISSCDGSHGARVFRGFTELFSGQVKTDVETLVAQCRLPIRVYDLADPKRRTYVQLEPHEPKLYSGSTLTTSLNNFANICIAKQLADDLVSTNASVVSSSRKVGYIVTCDDADEPELLQFLKHSPVRDVYEEWQPLLNLGVLLRLSGTCKYDLPGRGDLRTRGRQFQSALLAGAYPRTIFPLITNMKKTCGSSSTLASQKLVSNILEYKVVSELDDPVLTFSSEEVYRRYQLTHSEQEELDVLFGQASKILTLDYSR